MNTKFAVALLAAVMAAAVHAAPTPGVNVLNPVVVSPDDAGGPWTLGYQFTVQGPVTVTHLGAFDFGSDGFQVDHPVGLWTSGGTLLASTTATSGGLLIDGFRYTALLNNVLLQAGQTYVVAAGEYGEDADLYIVEGTVVSASPVTYTGSRFILGSGLPFPTALGATAVFPNTSGYYGANFLFETPTAPQGLPEPATLALTAAAVLAAAAASRRRAR